MAVAVNTGARFTSYIYEELFRDANSVRLEYNDIRVDIQIIVPVTTELKDISHSSTPR